MQQDEWSAIRISHSGDLLAFLPAHSLGFLRTIWK